MAFLLDTNTWIVYLKSPVSPIRSRLEKITPADVVGKPGAGSVPHIRICGTPGDPFWQRASQNEHPIQPENVGKHWAI
jgi:hypothetical protein